MKQAEELVKEIPKGLLSWYDFKPGSTILYVGEKEDAYAGVLAEKQLNLTCAPLSQISKKDAFDYIVCIETLELEEKPEAVLSDLKSLLKESGHMLLGMNNRFGIRYFCGDKDKYTKRNFDGLENYCRAYQAEADHFNGRCYNKAELREMLQGAGFETFQFFSVFSDLANPSLIFAEDYLPNEDMAGRIFPTYNDPKTVFLEEEKLYQGLIENGMFHRMANAYLIDCTNTGELCDVQHVTASTERGREDALLTVIHRSGIVEKKAVYPEGRKRLARLMEHSKDLKVHGLSVVEGELTGDTYKMPFVKAETGQMYLKRLLLTDKEQFLAAMDHFRDLILQSSEIIKEDMGDGNGAVLKKGYFDLVPLNSFFVDGEFTFFDQEFCEENYPANNLILRMVTTFYFHNMELQKFISREELFERYGLTPNLKQWQKNEYDFLADLRKEKELSIYHEQCRRDDYVLYENRQRLNYTQTDYNRLFVDIFQNVEGRRLILFGSGKFTERFLALYGKDYPVYAIIDNNKARWGQEMEGITIQSPEILKELPGNETKVLICIKNYLSVMKQLDDMGVKEYSIYDAGKSYPKKRKPIVQTKEEVGDTEPKKYHVGYVAGVFDLFHIGHLNMFRRAKEQCDYLIVGVVSDEGVERNKGKRPFIPFEERIEMVSACRYVDEAVEIPFDFGGTRDAYRLYQFDCQFSGSDYKEDPKWLADKMFLEQHGAEMVFFPYTEKTSSTKIKALIDKNLL
ncbi:MAG: adenylyltransferase/cytidyltransferase family protein [Lachnospiraceae bacterium]|nr:adenylyltransferase/cytidyltransferase family protein [Lachnospiraceae bacterium]